MWYIRLARQMSFCISLYSQSLLHDFLRYDQHRGQRLVFECVRFLLDSTQKSWLQVIRYIHYNITKIQRSFQYKLLSILFYKCKISKKLHNYIQRYFNYKQLSLDSQPAIREKNTVQSFFKHFGGREFLQLENFLSGSVLRTGLLLLEKYLICIL